MAENIKTARILKFDIFRYNPAEPDKPPYMQRFEIEEAPYMSLFLALNQIREELFAKEKHEMLNAFSQK